MRGRRAVIAGSVGSLAVLALGYRAWDRGVFTGGTGPAYAPWDDLNAPGPGDQRKPLRSAILAASPHNTQPWLFEVSDASIAVYADRTRHLGTFDPFRREMHLGLGCAIENLVRGAAALGIATDVQPVLGRLEPSPGDERVLAARIALRAGPALSDPLVSAIPRRHTHRGPYRDELIAAERLRWLVDAGLSPDVRVVLVTEGAARRELGALVVRATERIIADPEMSMDSFRWIRTGRREIVAHRDGVTIDTSGTGRLLTVVGKIMPDLGPAATDRFWLEATRDVHTATASVLGLILVRDRLDMTQALGAGRAWQRLQLAATAQGVAAQPLNQPIEMVDRNAVLGRSDEFRPGLAAFQQAPGWEPTFLFRLGYAAAVAPRSPRRLLRDVVRS